jgi:hypothetical protein
MAIKFNRSQTFATNGTVTAAGLHNLIDGTDIYQALITDQTAMTSVGSLDKLLIADSDLTAADAPRSVTVNELFEDALTLSTYTNVNATNLKYTSATGNYTLSTGATITNGTITNGTITNGTIANGTITNLTSSTASITLGTIPTLTTGTTTSTAANITTGTIPTLVSTTLITSGTGTATSPSIVPTGNTNTGLFFPATNTIGISTQGTEALRITSAGNIAIGATTSAQRLRVVGVSGTAQFSAGITGNTVNINAFDNDTIYMTASATTATQFVVGAASNIPLLLFTNNSEKVRIGSSGQIGIGGANYGTSGQVLTSAGASAAPSWQTVSAITSGTAVNSTSGTAIDFTGIPSGVKRISVLFNKVSISGTSNILIQLGTSGGIDGSSYDAQASIVNTAVATTNSTSGFVIRADDGNRRASGIMTIANVSSNIWVASGTIAHLGGTASAEMSSGAKELSATLDRVRIRSGNGSDTFDLGSVNILYES